jgi:Flp pilus assembly protein TadD
MMNRNINRKQIAGMVLTSALATALMAGCTAKGAPRADVSASRAELALAKGKSDKAVANAEAAVLAEPRNVAYRAMLGSAYLDAGRFASAVSSFEDAMTLGDQSPRTALSLALAHIANGNHPKAQAVLDDWRDVIAPADLGLAYALAGEADRGVMVLADTLRGGDNSPKVRQNLAYAYALAGHWREARLMAAQDVPGDQLDDRIGEWANNAQPEAFRQRVAMLLKVPATVRDAGQPAALALANSTSAEQLAAEASALAPRTAVAENGELPAEAAAEPAVTLARYEAPVTTPPQSFEAAFAAPAPSGATPAAVIADAVRFVNDPVVQKLPARYGFVAQGAKPKHNVGTGSHLVQLGSFASEAGARRAWGMYTKRHQGLGSHEMRITQAKVNGRTYWRVSAAGFDRLSAISMCSKVRTSSSDGCIAYSATKPLPGTVN